MSWIFGWYRTDARERTDAFAVRLRAWLDTERARHAQRSSSWHCVELDRVMLCKASVGAYADDGFEADERGVAALAGKCFFPSVFEEEQSDRRAREISSFRAGSDRVARLSMLRASRGTYALASYDSRSEELLLATDRLGVRPLFFAQVPEGIVFSTSLTALRQCGLLKIDVDMQGFSERLHLGYCLDDRTELDGVSVLRGGEALRLQAGAVVREQYYDLLEFVRNCETQPFDSGRVYRSFIDAVQIRARGEESSVASLSGGLDSRSVCAALTEVGAKLTTISYGVPSSQDQYFSRLMAERLGAKHLEVPQVHRSPRDSYSARTVLAALIDQVDVAEGRPCRMIWNGDGGSVGLGFVYLSEEAVSLAEREGRLLPGMLKVQPASAYLGGFRHGAQALFKDLFLKGLVDEERALAGLPSLVGLYLFLMRNDQRRHLHRHFDSILESGFDIQLPFFDAQFVETILSQPLDHFLGHRGYMDFLGEFSQPVLEVPWQAYPGHVPCPLPIPASLTYQWGERKNPYLLREWRRGALRGFWGVIRSYSAIRNEVRLGPLLFGLARQLSARTRDYSYVVRGPKLLADIRTDVPV